jgi:hypothetical protein
VSPQLLDKIGYVRRSPLANSLNDAENLGIGRFNPDVTAIRTPGLALGSRAELCRAQGYAINTAMQIGNELDGMPCIARVAKLLGSQSADAIYGRAEGCLFFVGEHANGSLRGLHFMRQDAGAARGAHGPA